MFAVTAMRIRIEVQLVDDGDRRLDDVAADTRRERLADFGRLRPGRPEPMLLLQDRREPMLLDLKATPVPEPRRKWWRRS